MRGIVVIVTAVALGGCGHMPAPQRSLPPLDLLQHCDEPPIQATTNGQLAQSAIRLRDALRGCNRDKAALREWAN